MDADRRVTILGRADFQVKVRGHKVPLLAVESALREIEQVADAAVMARPEKNGEATLLAYLVANGTGSLPSVRVLRRRLESRLPGYMVPGRFYQLRSMPLNPSGKMDRPGLASADCRELTAAVRFVDPITVSQQRMAAIWRELLEEEHVGITDSFFDVGGDSLKAVGLALKIGEVFGREPSLATLARYSTIELLTDWLGTDDDDVDDRIVMLKRSSVAGPAPLFAFTGRGGSVLSFVALADRVEQDRDIIGLQLPGVLETERPFDCVEPLAIEMLERMRSVQPRGPYHMLGYSFGGLVAYEIACQLEEQGEEVEYLAFIDSRLPVGGPIRHLAKRLSRRLRQVDLRTRGGWREVIARARGQMGAECSEDAQETGLSPVEIRMERIATASRRAAARYRARRYGGSLYLLKCIGGQDQSPGSRGESNCHGWDSVVDGPIHQVAVPGVHMGVFGQGCIGGLAAAVNRTLARHGSRSR